MAETRMPVGVPHAMTQEAFRLEAFPGLEIDVQALLAEQGAVS